MRVAIFETGDPTTTVFPPLRRSRNDQRTRSEALLCDSTAPPSVTDAEFHTGVIFELFGNLVVWPYVCGLLVALYVEPKQIADPKWRRVPLEDAAEPVPNSEAG